MVFVGHKSSGKVLLIGKILKETKTKKDMLQLYQKEGRGSFKTSTKLYNIQDGPIPKTTASSKNYKGDVAVLFVSGKRDEFNLGFQLAGDKEETDIRHILESGVKKLVVVITKMDESGVNWSEKRFDQIVERLTKVLQKRGYDPTCGNCVFLPLASFSLLGLSLPTGSYAPWNTEEPLISYLDKIDGRPSFMSAGEDDEEDEGQEVKKIKLENFKKQGNIFSNELDHIIDQESSSSPTSGVRTSPRIGTPTPEYQEYQDELKKNEEKQASKDIFDFP